METSSRRSELITQLTCFLPVLDGTRAAEVMECLELLSEKPGRDGVPEVIERLLVLHRTIDEEEDELLARTSSFLVLAREIKHI